MVNLWARYFHEFLFSNFSADYFEEKQYYKISKFRIRYLYLQPCDAFSIWEFSYPYSNQGTLSVLRIFVHSLPCQFSYQKMFNSNFSVKSQHTLLDFSHLTVFFQYGLDYWFWFQFSSRSWANPGEVSMDSNSLYKTLIFILNTPPRTMAP